MDIGLNISDKIYDSFDKIAIATIEISTTHKLYSLVREKIWDIILNLIDDNRPWI